MLAKPVTRKICNEIGRDDFVSWSSILFSYSSIVRSSESFGLNMSVYVITVDNSTRKNWHQACKWRHRDLRKGSYISPHMQHTPTFGDIITYIETWSLPVPISAPSPHLCPHLCTQEITTVSKETRKKCYPLFTYLSLSRAFQE